MITIIGAGPIGCYTGYLLAKAGLDVEIFEEHKVLGKPVQCTGIVTNSFKNIIKPRKEFLVNTLNKVKVFAPNNDFLELNLKREEFVIDRVKFDQYLANKAVDNGVKLYVNHKFIGKEKDRLIVKDLSNNKVKKKKYNYLIGADGPLSQVAKTFSLYGKRDFFIGCQARVKVNINPDCYETYFGRDFPNFFGWVVPESDKVARIGLAAKANSVYFFKKFLHRKKIKGKDIIERQSGVMPVYNPKIKTKKNNVFLVGDAATHVKATTGGGLIHGLIAAECLAESIIKNKSYENICRKKIEKDLRIHLMIRNILNKFTDKDYNYLIELAGKKKKVKKIIETYDRDFPMKFSFKLLLNEPRFLFFLKKIL